MVRGERGVAWANTLIYYLPPSRLPEFLIGCVAGQLFLKPKRAGFFRRRWAREAATMLILVLILITAWFASEPKVGRFSYFAIYTPLAVALVYVLASGSSVISSILDMGIVLLLGEASYSLYLLHWPLILLICRVGAHDWGWGSIAILCVVLPLVSVGVFLFIETPCRRWLRRSSIAPFKLEANAGDAISRMV